jgi:hypothetical protein
MIGSILWRILRYLYAAYYLYVGIFLALSLIGLVSMPPLKISAQSAAFQEALSQTGFMDPALAVTYIIAAAALLIIPADGIQGFQSIVDTHSSATWTGLWPDRGQFAA